jgi:hypothetical protein
VSVWVDVDFATKFFFEFAYYGGVFADAALEDDWFFDLFAFGEVVKIVQYNCTAKSCDYVGF